jgi:acetoin utilization deacetylase AcuC-like enzyme
MIPVYYDPVFLRHETGSHPECPARLVSLIEHLRGSELVRSIEIRPAEPAARHSIEAVHDPEYVGEIERFCAAGGGWLDPDTRCSPASFEVATRACGAVCQAVAEVIAGKSATAFCAVRPPGHHAESNRAMGFCLLNQVAIAAEHAIRDFRLQRVLIVDWDVHHGNGTQQIFWERPDVGFVSIHRFPFYPGTGTVAETGSGAGAGFTLNIPLPFGTPPAVFLKHFKRGVENMARRIRPEIVLVSAGFDAFIDDPVGSLGLQPEHFAELTKFVWEIAGEYCQHKLVSALEGGYHLQGLAHCAEHHLLALADGLKQRESR